MFKKFIKETFRSLRKNKGYSILNIAGLSIGIACAGLIFLWAEDEVNFDNNNIKKDRIFIVKTNDNVDNGVFTHSSTPGPLAASMQSSLPGIANTCRTTEGNMSMLMQAGNKSLYEPGHYAEPSIFSIFTLPFLQGNPEDAFKQLHSLVLTSTAAKKLFGSDANVIGKTVRMDNKQDYVITGVLKDLPENASMQFEWLAPFQSWLHDNAWAEKWDNYGISTYIELKAGSDAAVINRKLLTPMYDFTTQKNETTASSVHEFLFAMNDWHLRDDFANGKETGGGRIQYLRLFTVIAWIILFIACINFMNLATAGSEKRAKEVGVKKVLGAGKTMLILQFMGEAICMALLACAIAGIMMLAVLPSFNHLVQKDLLPGLVSPTHIMALLSLALICGLVAGSYPSLYLSSFNPAFVLKGIKSKSGSAAFIRKGLVVMQFSVSIILIIGTIIIYRQIQHVKSRDLGYNKNNLIQVEAKTDLVQKFSSVKTDILNTGVAENATLADHETISDGNNTTGISWPGKDPGSSIVISQRVVSAEFMKTIGMHLTEGRDFESTDIVKFGDNHMPADSTQIFHVIITESMEKLMGKGSAIGKIMERQGNPLTFHMQVTGVVKDYVYGNMYGQAAPVIFYNIPQYTNLMYIRLKEQADPEKALVKISALMKQDNPAYPFQYKFVDDQFNNLFASEMLISKLSRIFSALAIFISCLGLFGLAAYSAERRTREIGVRKVLGASVSGITALLSKDFLILVGLSCVIAFPLAWWLMSSWLRNFEYRITIGSWIYLIAGAAATLIALLTISFQSVKAAMANPIKSLRTE